MGGCASSLLGTAPSNNAPDMEMNFFEDESKLPLIDGAFDELRAKSAFVAASGASNKQGRRGSTVTAIYSADVLSIALTSLGFTFDKELLQDAFDEFDDEGRSLMMQDFFSLCKKLLAEPFYLKQTSLRRRFQAEYSMAFESAAHAHNSSEDEVQMDKNGVPVHNQGLTSIDALKAALTSLGATQGSMTAVCDHLVQQCKSQDVPFAVSFVAFVDTCVKFNIAPGSSGAPMLQKV